MPGDKSEILRAVLKNPSAREAVIRLQFKKFRDIHIKKHLQKSNKKLVKYADGTIWNNLGRKLAGPKRLVKRSLKKTRKAKKLSEEELIEETKMIDILFLHQNSEIKSGDPSMVGISKVEGSTKQRLPKEPPSKKLLIKQAQSEAHKIQMVDRPEEDREERMCEEAKQKYEKVIKIFQAQQVQFVDLAAEEEEEEEKEHNRMMEEYEALMKRLKYQNEEEKKKNEDPLKIYIQSLIKEYNEETENMKADSEREKIEFMKTCQEIINNLQDHEDKMQH